MIDEILSQIEAKAGEEISPKLQGDLNKVRKLFATVSKEKERLESEIETAEKAKATAESESISRKKAIAKLEAELEREKAALELKDSDIADLKKKAENPALPEDYETLKSENEKYKTQLTEYVNGKRQELAKIYETKLSQHPKWEKAKEFFKMPPAEEGKIKWDELTEDDLNSNFAKIKEWEGLGYFEDAQPTMQHGFSGMKTQSGDPDLSNLKTIEDIQDFAVKELTR